MRTEKNGKLLRVTALLFVAATFVLTGCGALDVISALPAQAEARVAQLREAVTDQEVAADAVAPEAEATPDPAKDSPPLSANVVVAALEDALTDIYENVSPSVVYIEVWKRSSGLNVLGMPFAFPEPEQPDQDLPLEQGSGSGFVWDREGHIVTNNHVVAGAERIRVTFSDGTTAAAMLVGANRDSDLAVLQVDVSSDLLMPVRLGDSNIVEVGEVVVAIGNPFGLESTMTVGFVSGLGRTLPVESDTLGGPTYSIPDVIQTDAPINPGNSGGVLVSDQGEVVGVTTAIASSVGQSSGIGFVVPAAIVQQVVPQLITQGSYEVPWLGISGSSLTPDIAEAMDLPEAQRGVLIADVIDGSPAAKAGLRGSQREVQIDGLTAQIGGDVIVAIDDQPVRAFEDLSAYLFRSTLVGQEVTLVALRDGKRVELTATLQARPTEEMPVQVTEEELEAESTGAAWLGILGQTLTPEIAEAMDLPSDQEGVLVVQVMPGSPADEAGLRGGERPFATDGQSTWADGDVIVEWHDTPVTDMDGLRELVSQAAPGEDITLTILRDGDRVELGLTLEARPSP